jgi:hypothetical protein
VFARGLCLIGASAILLIGNVAPAYSVDDESDVPAVAVDLDISVHDAEARLLLRAAYEDAIEFVVGHPNEFGGAYIDGSGRLVVLLVSTNSLGADDVRQLVPRTAPVAFVNAVRSRSELEAIQRETLSAADEFRLHNVPLVAVGLDTARNLVTVLVNGEADPSVFGFFKHANSGVRIVAASPGVSATCTSRLACTPWRGGIKITGPGGCTYGFNEGTAGGSIRMFTAAHCGSGTFKHNGVTIGTTSFNSLDSGWEDYGDFQLVPTSFSGGKNSIYVNDSVKARNILSRRATALQVQGDSLCKSGITTGYGCGTIVDDSIYYTLAYSGPNVEIWGKAASFAMDLGDSGGPVFLNNAGYGLMSGILPGYGNVYAPLETAEYLVGTHLCIDSDC